MSAVLQVIKDKKQLAKVTVAGNVFIIGRSPQCDLPLDEELASRQHVEIVLEKGHYWVRDRGSRNGTFVNGEKIEDRRKLVDGDEIGVGSTRLKFLWNNASDDSDAPGEGETRVASLSDEDEKALGMKVVSKADKGAFEVKLRVIDGPLSGGVFKDWDGPLTIGRGLKNHVVLLDDAVSTSHARIVQQGEQYYIEDLNSANGTFMDGVKVQRTRLENGRKIKVGTSTLAFEMVDLRRQKRNLRVALISSASVVLIALLAKHFQPKDIALEHLTVASQFENTGDFARALKESQVAKDIDPRRQAAIDGVNRVNNEIEAVSTLAEAEKEAAAEHYDKAKELCYRVENLTPNPLPKALELEAVIKSIENANTALSARNWKSAKQLLDDAQQAYPSSELIRQRLEEAQMEITSEEDLTQAKDDLQHGQADAAGPLLQSIPEKSVYFAEAKELLERIARDREVAGDLEKARTLYRAGNLNDSLNETGVGLKLIGTNPGLLALQARINQMSALVGPLADAEAMAQPDDVDALLQYQKACNDVLALEDDPLNILHKRAQDAAAKVGQRLTEVSQADVARAEESLQAGHRVQALSSYDLAVKASPGDQEVAEAREKLYQQIVADCRRLYQEGLVHEDLGQTDLAQAAYKKVLEIGIPGQDYYKKAENKLKGIGQ
jgi:pSer/pThr/pTyr-binding forkhead associated (FHA) protein